MAATKDTRLNIEIPLPALVTHGNSSITHRETIRDSCPAGLASRSRPLLDPTHSGRPAPGTRRPAQRLRTCPTGQGDPLPRGGRPGSVRQFVEADLLPLSDLRLSWGMTDRWP